MQHLFDSAQMILKLGIGTVAVVGSYLLVKVRLQF